MNQAGKQPKETTFRPIISYNIPFIVLTVFHNIPVNSLLADKYTFIYCMYNCIYIGQLSCDLADSRCWLLRLLGLLALHRAPLHRTLTSSSRSTDDAGSCSVQSSYFQVGIAGSWSQGIYCSIQIARIVASGNHSIQIAGHLCSFTEGIGIAGYSSVDPVFLLSCQDCRDHLSPQPPGIGRSVHLFSYRSGLPDSSILSPLCRSSVSVSPRLLSSSVLEWLPSLPLQ